MVNKTVWTNNAKEGFVENPETTITKPAKTSNPTNESSSVPDFGKTDDYVGKDPNELILSGKPVPEQSKTDTETTDPPTPSEELKDSVDKMDAKKIKSIYDNAISDAINNIFGINEIIAKKIVSAFYENIDTPEAKNDIQILAFQISLWFILLFASYLIAVNWWNIWCYSEFKFNFKWLIFIVLHWPMSGPLNAIEFLNYFLTGLRMDEKLKSEYPAIQKFMNSLWALRPVLFSLVHLLIFLILVFMPIGGIVESMMTGKGVLFIIISALSVYYFLSMFIKEEWYAKFLKCGTVIVYLVLVVLLICTAVLMLVFIYMMCPLFTIYLLGLSCISLFLFEHVNAYNRWEEIFRDLIEAISGKDKKLSFEDKVFNNFHSIYFFIMVFAIVIYSLYASSNLKNEPLTAVSITFTLFLLILFSMRFGGLLYYIIGGGGNGGAAAAVVIPSSENINYVPPPTPPAANNGIMSSIPPSTSMENNVNNYDYGLSNKSVYSSIPPSTSMGNNVNNYDYGLSNQSVYSSIPPSMGNKVNSTKQTPYKNAASALLQVGKALNNNGLNSAINSVSNSGIMNQLGSLF